MSPLIFLSLILLLVDVAHSIPRTVRLSCNDKSTSMGFPVVQAGCRYFYYCQNRQKSTEANVIPKTYPCPEGLFDFKLQTCVVPTASFICEETESNHCKPKCNCKLCHCHSKLCKTRCVRYRNEWCRDRFPRARNPNIFDCSGKFPGASYSDPYFDCQVYHTCHQNHLGSPLSRRTRQCPPGRAFDQLRLSCQPIGSFDCENVSKWYLIRNPNEKPSIPVRVLSNINKEEPELSATIVDKVGEVPNAPITIPIVTVSLETFDCPEYQCCPDQCPPCHEVCPFGTCNQDWCGSFYGDKLEIFEPENEDYLIFNFDDNEESDTNLFGNNCKGKVLGGLYANTTSNCQSFYYCVNNASKLKEVEQQCPIGTYFNQRLRVCDWTLDFPCQDSHLYF